jgi:hypothetical protein
MADYREVREIARSTWTAVLNVEVDDSADFFSLGGHSFIAVQIITKLNEQLATRTPVTALLDHPRFDDFVGVLAREAQAVRSSAGSERAGQ